MKRGLLITLLSILAVSIIYYIIMIIGFTKALNERYMRVYTEMESVLTPEEINQLLDSGVESEVL